MKQNKTENSLIGVLFLAVCLRFYNNKAQTQMENIMLLREQPGELRG